MNAAARRIAPDRAQSTPRQLGFAPQRPLAEPLPLRSASLRANRADILGFLPKLARLGNGWIGTHEAAPFRRYACLTPLAVAVLSLLLGDEGIDYLTFEVRTHMRFLVIGTGKTRRALRGALYELEAFGLGERLALDRRARKLGGVAMRFARFVSRRELQELALKAAAEWERQRLEARAERRPMRRAWPLEGGRISPIGKRGRTAVAGCLNSAPDFPPSLDPSRLPSKLKASLGLVTPPSARVCAPVENCVPAEDGRGVVAPSSDLNRRGHVDRGATAPLETPTDSIPVGVARNSRAARETGESAVPAPPARLPAAHAGSETGVTRGQEHAGCRASAPRGGVDAPRPDAGERRTAGRVQGPPRAAAGGGLPPPDVLAIMRALVDAPDGARPGHTRPNPIQPDPTGLEPPHAPGGAAPPDTPDGPGLTDDERAELELALERARRGGS